MDKPKAPDDQRNWESLDIYLFSNGQQHSPPRKYHLKCDKLKNWDTTLRFLAHSQYGSMVSDIELYTLNGNKIDSPLELKNDAAYVAVKPPDVFILAGYDIYLVKASRSWEKRQEKLLSCNTINKTGNNSCTQNCVKNCIISPNTQKEDIENTDCARKTNYNLADNPYRKKFSVDRKKYNIINKNNSENIKPVKKDLKAPRNKNNSIISKTEINNHIKEFVPFKNPNAIIKRRLYKDRAKQKVLANEKENSKANLQTVIIGNGTTSSNPNAYKLQQQVKDDTKINNITNNNNLRSDIDSNVYKNISIPNIGTDTRPFFLDVNENELELNNKIENIPESASIEKMNKTISIISSTADMGEASKRDKEQNTDIVDKDGKFNIFLNIYLKDYATINPEKNFFLKISNSNLRILSRKASHANIHDMQSKGGIHSKSNSSQIEKPIENAFDIEEMKTTEGCNKFKIIRCKCENDVEVAQNVKEGFIILVPNSEKLLNRNDEVNIEMVDKETQIDTTSITNAASKNFKITNNTKDQKTLKKEEEHINLRPSDTFTQTDWSNVLLQTIRHEDGHHTFCLPPLALLKKYNINTV